MKQHRKLFMGATFVAVFLAAGVGSVFAQTPPTAPPPGSTLEQRVAQRKNERKVQLDDRSQRRLNQRCTPAQSVLRRMQQDVSPMLSNRTKVYQRIDAKLWVIIGELKLADKDTFELEKRRIVLAEKAEAFRVLGTQYQQVIDDLVVINCQADVTGFKALVDTARIYHEQLRTSATDIRDYVVNDIKPLLTDFAAELQPKSSTEGEG